MQCVRRLQVRSRRYAVLVLVVSSTDCDPGVAEGLYRETRGLGINILLMEPGRFRTKLLASTNMKAVRSSIPDYMERSEAHVSTLERDSGLQPGDPEKFVDITLDLVRQEGVAAGKDIPFRLPLGEDVFVDVKGKCEETLDVLEKWAPTIKSTNLET